MALPGGPSTIFGVDYEIHFMVYQLTRLISGQIDAVRAQAKQVLSLSRDRPVSIDSSMEGLQENFVDDLVIFTSQGQEYFNCKFQNTAAKPWIVADLKSRGILLDLFSQWKLRQEEKVHFVSASSCSFIASIMEQNANGAEGEEEVLVHLNEKTDKKEWEAVKTHLKCTGDQLVLFSKHLRFQHLSFDTLKELSKSELRFLVADVDKAIDKLLAIAKNSAKIREKLTFPLVKNRLQIEGVIFEKEDLGLDLPALMFSASTSLLVATDCFDSGGRIETKEEERVFHRIATKQDKRHQAQILVVKGEKGCGKTSVLRQTLLKIKNENIPVLGLKTDQLAVTSEDELSQRIKLKGNSLSSVLKKVLQQNQKAVLILDQLDALSLSSSTNREALNFYYRLIYELSEYSGLSIIISSRTFDLQYDPVLCNLNSSNRSSNLITEEIEIFGFSTDQVNKYIQENGPNLYI